MFRKSARLPVLFYHNPGLWLPYENRRRLFNEAGGSVPLPAESQRHARRGIFQQAGTCRTVDAAFSAPDLGMLHHRHAPHRWRQNRCQVKTQAASAVMREEDLPKCLLQEPSPQTETDILAVLRSFDQNPGKVDPGPRPDGALWLWDFHHHIDFSYCCCGGSGRLGKMLGKKPRKAIFGNGLEVTDRTD